MVRRRRLRLHALDHRPRNPLARSHRTPRPPLQRLSRRPGLRTRHLRRNGPDLQRPPRVRHARRGRRILLHADRAQYLPRTPDPRPRPPSRRNRNLGRQLHLRLGHRRRRPALLDPRKPSPRRTGHNRQRPRHRYAHRCPHRRRQSHRAHPYRPHRTRRSLRQLRPRRAHARHRARPERSQRSLPRQSLARAPRTRSRRRLAGLLPRLRRTLLARRHSDSESQNLRSSLFNQQLTTMLLEGLHIPLTTPFHPDGRLNSPKLAANIARYSKTPAAGLIVLCPSGEPTLLSDDETREVLRTAAEAAAPEKVLIAGISRDSVHATLDLANFAASLDYDAVLVGVPSVLTHFSLAQEQSGLRLREL